MTLKILFLIPLFSGTIFAGDHNSASPDDANSLWNYGWSWTVDALSNIPLLGSYFSAEPSPLPNHEPNAPIQVHQEQEPEKIDIVASDEQLQNIARRIQIMLAHVTPETPVDNAAPRYSPPRFRESRIEPRYDSSTNVEDFERFLGFHHLLWQGSATYRKTWLGVEKLLNPQRLAFMSVDNLAFDAEANFPLHAIRIREPKLLSDSRVISLLAFELTNFWHMTEFQKADIDTWSGSTFGRENIGLEDISFAYVREYIEQKGLVIHNKIMTEFLNSFPNMGPGEWFINAAVNKETVLREFNQYIISDNAEEHIKYYANYFEQKIRPQLQQNRSQNVSERMKKFHSTPETISGGDAGNYVKVDGKWIVLE